jgi:FlaG/FlaF family flagellin (archaellin)
MTRNDTTDMTGTESDTTSATDEPALATVTRNLRERLSGLAGDERAVSPVIGFVLMFAIVILALTLYQVDVVPAQNAEAEFTHSQDVEKQMSQLNDAIGDASTHGATQSMSIAAGMQYPDRALAINPGPPTGNLRTSGDTYTVRIENVKATGDNAKYFNQSTYSDAFEFESREVVYGIDYNEYQQDPSVTIAPGLSFASYRDGTVVRSTSMVSGNRIDLALLDPNSEYRSSSSVADVDVVPTSASTKYMSVEPTGGNPKITIETSLSLSPDAANELEHRLEERDRVTGASYTDGSPSTITLTLEGGDETYDLRMTEAGLGDVTERGPHYLVNEDSLRNPSLILGESTTLTVSARNVLGNPVANAEVEAAVTGSSTGTGTFDRGGSDPTTATAMTGENGRATFAFSPDSVDPVEIEASLTDGSGDTDLDTVSYTIEADTRQGFIDNGYRSDVTIADVSRDQDELEVTFKNDRGEEVTAETIQLNGGVGQKNDPVTSADIGSTTIELNKGPQALNADEFSIPAGGTETATLTFNTDPNKAGILIMDVTFTEGDRTLSATYAISVVKG